MVFYENSEPLFELGKKCILCGISVIALIVLMFIVSPDFLSYRWCSVRTVSPTYLVRVEPESQSLSSSPLVLADLTICTRIGVNSPCNKLQLIESVLNL